MPSFSHPRHRRAALFLACTGVGALILHAGESGEWTTGVVWPEPKVVEPGTLGSPPSDAIVLFDGKSLDAWHGGEKWKIQDGYAVDQGTSITTKQSFGDCQLHVEWQIPADTKGDGQGRGNSGVYLMGLYEIQILESYKNQNKTYFDGQAGAIYKQRPPLVNACRKPGEWQAYDIVFMAPRFDDKGKLVSPAYMTIFQNGVLIQNHFALMGHTDYYQPPRYDRVPPRQPLSIQYHNEPLHFRNIWIRELEDDHNDLLIPFREKLNTAPAKG